MACHLSQLLSQGWVVLVHSPHGILVVLKNTFAVFRAQLLKSRTQRLARHIVDKVLEFRGVCEASGCQWQGQEEK
jgi:hypothetical protein